MQGPSEGGVLHVNEPIGVCLMQESSEGGVSHVNEPIGGVFFMNLQKVESRM